MTKLKPQSFPRPFVENVDNVDMQITCMPVAVGKAPFSKGENKKRGIFQASDA